MPYVAVKHQNLLKKQEAKGLLSNLGIRTPLSKISLLGDVRLLLAGDKFMPEMHLTQPGFTYSACGQFTNWRFKTCLQK